MCMLSPSSPGSVEPEKEEALAGQGITNQNPLFEANKPRQTRVVNRSMRIKKPE